MLFSSTLAIPLLGAAVVVGGTTNSQIDEFDWNSIEPSPELIYQPCYDGFKCARLQLPLDWLNHTNPKTVAIAIVVLPATVPQHDAAFGGTVVLNPGGPGGSGIKWARAMGRHIQRILDRNRHYEILSFDPRGVMYTTPRADCFDDDPLGRTAFLLQMRGIGGLDGPEDALRRHVSLTNSFATLCTQTNVHTDILGYMSTASVARDMVEIIDRVAELRRKSSASLSAVSETQQRILGRGSADIGPTKIQYYGVSYGTVLGNTFASMFPERVGRLILDGVVDANDYVRGDWTGCLFDTEKALVHFYKQCYRSGDRCPLFNQDDADYTSIQRRVGSLIEAAETNPLPYIHGRRIELLNANDIRRAMYLPLYLPIPGYESLAKVLAAALGGNYRLIWEQADVPKIDESCNAEEITEPLPQPGFDDALISIACGDAVDNRGKNIPYYTKLVHKMKSVSETYGEFFSNIPVSCFSWAVRPKWRFEGPFSSPPGVTPLTSGALQGKPVPPSAPLLFLSSRLDPATPLRNAFSMSAGHAGSAVVVQESVSHSTLLAGTSDCVANIIRDYMEYGIVPNNGTVCEADEKCQPWRSENCHLGEVASALGL